jgi:DNA-directed RNA polymerase subunit H (RpoH/RPB5)
MAHDDLQEYLIRFGLAVRGVWWMMEDRGYALDEWKRNLLKKTPLEIAHTGLETARAKQCSLGQAFSSKFGGGAKDCLHVVVFDRNFDEAKGKEVMVSSNLLRRSIEELDADARAIFLLPNKLSPDAKKLAAKFAARIQTLTFERMFIPVGRHVQVPRHIRLSEKDANAFEEARRIQRHQLLVLRLDDPVAQYYGFKVGDVVRIERPSGVAYRVVEE